MRAGGGRGVIASCAVAFFLAFAVALGAVGLGFGAAGAGAAAESPGASAVGSRGVPLAFADVVTDERAGEEAELPEAITVQFRQGIGVIGSANEAALGMTVEEAFAQANIERPSAESGEGEFKGWAAENGAVTAYRSYMPLSEAYKLAGSERVLQLYPVFGPAVQPHVRFYGQDGKTLLAEADIEPWQTLDGSDAAPSLSVKDGEGASALRKLGHSFVGWVDEDGLLCRSDAPLTDDVSLVPAYVKLSANLSKLKRASADLSEAFLVHEGLEKSLDVGFGLEKAGSPDEGLVAAAADDGCAIANSYRVTFGFLMDDERTLVRKGFGSITVKLPAVSQDGTRVRVYWLKLDGTVGRTAVRKVDQGTVTLKLTNYGVAAGGNVAISSKVLSDSSPSSGADDENEPRAGTLYPDEASSGSPSQPGAGVAAPASSADGVRAVPAVTSSGRGGTPAGSSSGPSGPSGSAEDSADRSGLESAGAAGLDDGEDAEADDTEADDDALSAAENSIAVQHGTKDGGLLYGASMLLIAAVAATAWWLAFKRERRRGAIADSVAEPAPASAEGSG